MALKNSEMHLFNLKKFIAPFYFLIEEALWSCEKNRDSYVKMLRMMWNVQKDGLEKISSACVRVCVYTCVRAGQSLKTRMPSGTLHIPSSWFSVFFQTFLYEEAKIDRNSFS